MFDLQPDGHAPAEQLFGEATTARTKTTSHVKWLLNEHAALTGRQGQLEERIAALQAELDEVRERRTALRVSASLFEDMPELSCVAPVAPWQGKYGRRGALQDFMADVLKRAQPEAVSTTTMCDLVIERFGLGPMAPAERRDYYTATVRPQLRVFEKRGLATSQTSVLGGRGRSTAWRWRDPMPTLADLARHADTARPSDLASTMTWRGEGDVWGSQAAGGRTRAEGASGLEFEPGHVLEFGLAPGVAAAAGSHQ